ncbi:hypothetical protein [Methylomonas rivi]|uniref:Uncharacterized protein n=1 Tax=Methylomonas rivi TaxID=2952226 RepID=A0ABT1U3R6_9GAMM|nr:hypothetical protein [Methylomonas sp. WSC-6]MBS4051317.1 hypothetical protein [Methylomonas sp.]MCQ8128489.1 hypothetical protein [Methylomonas sp. WSC-6]
MIKKHFDLIFVALLTLSLVFYDLTLELLTEIAHFFFELLFESFEWFELGIEHLIEHLFHTEHHASQIATFYILLLIGGLVFYQLWKALPRLYRYFKRRLLEIWVRRKTEWELYWLTLTLPYKVALVATALGVAYLASFFVM